MRNLVDFKTFVKLNETALVVPMGESAEEITTKLENAITNKFVCTIYYRGEKKGVVDDGYRYIEPYALGFNKHGNTVVRARLIKGASRSGRIDPKLIPGWRLYRLDRISIVTQALQKFTEPHEGYNANDSGMTEVTFTAQF